MRPVDAGVEDHDDRARAVVPERRCLIRLDARNAFRQRRMARRVLDHVRHHASQRLQHAQAVGADLDRHHRGRAAEVADHPVGNTAQASADHALGRGDVLALGDDVRGGRQLDLGHVRGVDLHEDPNGASLKCLLMELGRHQRPLLAAAPGRGGEDEDGSEDEREDDPPALLEPHGDCLVARGRESRRGWLPREAVRRIGGPR